MKFKENLLIALVFTLLTTIVGCKSAENIEDHGNKASRSALVTALLAEAQSAANRNHLTIPAEGSALSYIRKAQDLQTGNIEIQRALDDLVEKYIVLAENSRTQGDISSAQIYLDRALSAHPTHPSIPPARTQLKRAQSTTSQDFDIEIKELDTKSDDLVKHLKRIGLMGRDPACTVTIIGRNDSEARWIYQALSNSKGSRRIKANIKISSIPHIKIGCLRNK